MVDIGFAETSYTTSEAIGSVSVCVDISSAQLERNVSVTVRSVTAGAAVGKLLNPKQKFRYVNQHTMSLWRGCNVLHATFELSKSPLP